MRFSRNALNLGSEDIRCSSVDGHIGLPAGAPTDEIIRREVNDAEVFVGLITPKSMKSVYVLFELGSAMGGQKTVFPLLASGATWERLEGPLRSINALDCSNRSQVEQFIEEVAKELEVDPDRPAAYSAAVGDLVEASAAAEHVAEPSSGQLTPEASEVKQVRNPRSRMRVRRFRKKHNAYLSKHLKTKPDRFERFVRPAARKCQTRAKSFAELGDRRSEALWEAAIQELIDHGLLQDPIGSDMMFEIDARGLSCRR